MTPAAVERRSPARDGLRSMAAPVLKEILRHPFWAGIRSGTLPPAALWHYAAQDTHHLVPSYGRALARLAADADAGDDAEAALLASAAAATFGSLPRLNDELARLATELTPTDISIPGSIPSPTSLPSSTLVSIPVPITTPAPDPVPTSTPAASPDVLGYASFLLAAPLAGFSAGLGGLLPMTWFHLWVSQELRRTFDPGSRYARWIDQYCAYDGYEHYVDQFLMLVDAEAQRCSNREWDGLVESFSTAARYELAFAHEAWRRRGWPS